MIQSLLIRKIKQSKDGISVTNLCEDKDNLVGRHQALLVDLAPVFDWAAISAEITTQKALLNPLYVGLPADDVNGGVANEARAAARTAYMELRLMQANGIAKLTNFKQSLRKSWYNIKG